MAEGGVSKKGLCEGLVGGRGNPRPKQVFATSWLEERGVNPRTLREVGWRKGGSTKPISNPVEVFARRRLEERGGPEWGFCKTLVRGLG